MPEKVPLKECPSGLFWRDGQLFFKPARQPTGYIQAFLIRDGVAHVMGLWNEVEPTTVQDHICDDTCGYDTEGDRLVALMETEKNT